MVRLPTYGDTTRTPDRRANIGQLTNLPPPAPSNCLGKLANYVVRLYTDRPTNLNKFDHFQSPFAALKFCDKALVPSKPGGQLLLCQISLFPSIDQQSQ